MKANEQPDIVRGPPIWGMLVALALAISLLFVIDLLRPRDVGAAEEFLANKGWSQLQIESTSSYCGRNEKLFHFEGSYKNKAHKSGRLCLHLIRGESAFTAEVATPTLSTKEFKQLFGIERPRADAEAPMDPVRNSSATTQ